MSYHYKHQVRVRYAECDQMGFVHHSAFVLYFEEARTEAMRSLGLIYKDMEADGILMPVRHVEITYKKAGRYDDLLTIDVMIAERPNLRCNIEYHTWNEAGEFLNSGRTELFFVQKHNLRPTPLPPHYSSKIDEVFPV